MPGSPSNFYQFYSAEEVAAELVLLKEEMSGGTITNISGAMKSTAFRFIPIEDRMDAIGYRMRQLGMTPPRAQKVQNVLTGGRVESRDAAWEARG